MTRTVVLVVGSDTEWVEETAECLDSALAIECATATTVEDPTDRATALDANCVVATPTEAFEPMLSSLDETAPVVAFVDSESAAETALAVDVADVRWRSDTPDQYDRLATGVENAIRRRDEKPYDDPRRDEQLEEFASIVSHDLRSPIQTVSSALDLARVQCDSTHLDDADQALQRLDRLVEDLLALARQGQRVDSVASVSLERRARSVWPDPDSAHLTVEETDPIEADQNRLDRLLANLLRNAIEHASDGERGVTVRVGTTAEGFFVADDGPGIPEEERQRVFDPGHTTSEEGTGFGLAIVDRIATAHGWSVSVTESQSGGARFEVSGVEVAPD